MKNPSTTFPQLWTFSFLWVAWSFRNFLLSLLVNRQSFKAYSCWKTSSRSREVSPFKKIGHLFQGPVMIFWNSSRIRFWSILNNPVRTVEKNRSHVFHSIRGKIKHVQCLLFFTSCKCKITFPYSKYLEILSRCRSFSTRTTFYSSFITSLRKPTKFLPIQILCWYKKNQSELITYPNESDFITFFMSLSLLWY